MAEDSVLSLVDEDSDDAEALQYADLNAQLVKDLKEHVHAASDSDDECESSDDDSAKMIVTNGDALHDHDYAGLNHHKPTVERRFYRSMVWGSIAWYIALGRGLSRLGLKGAHLGTLRQVTRIGAGWRRAALPQVLHFKVRIAGVKTRVYRPADQAPGQKLPLCIFIHGGGWVMCTARTYHKFTLELCKDINAVVVSVDYRLAPEHPYPIPLDDCIAATRAILESDKWPDVVGPHLAGWIDLSRVAMAGDSAGGNLCCATALELIRSGDIEAKLRALCLICPSTQAISTEFPSVRKYGRHSTARSGWFLANYAGVVDPSLTLVRTIKYGRHVPDRFLANFVAHFVENCEDWHPADDGNDLPEVEVARQAGVPQAITELAMSRRAWPLIARHEHLGQLPATFVQTCSDDSLKDEGLVFSRLLRHCGVADVRYFYLPRSQHCEPIFHNTIPTKAAKLGYRQICSFLTDVIAPKPQVSA